MYGFRFMSMWRRTAVLFSWCVVIWGGEGCEGTPPHSGTLGPGLPESPAPGPSDEGWQLVFSDEFDSGEQPISVNSRKWGHEVNCWGGGNDEQQCYTARPENAFLRGGLLHIVAKEESYSGPSLTDDDPNYDPNDVSVTLPFTSARLRSKNRFDFKYGRVELRAQLTAGQGMWPAVWMLPTDFAYGPWPISGEIDILEAVNLGVEGSPNEVHGTLHYGLPWPQWSAQGASFEADEDLSRVFHVYAIEWEADEIRWYVDGVHYQTQHSDGWYHYVWQGQEAGFGSAGPRAPFDKEFHILLNLAVGGNFPGTPDNDWDTDRSLLIDYVRVYQCVGISGVSEDGTGCSGLADPVNEAIVVNEDAGRPRTQRYVVLLDGPTRLEAKEPGSSGLTFNPGSYQAAEGNVASSFTDIDGDRRVWDVVFTGPGNVYLTAVAADVQYETSGIVLDGGSGWRNVGELSFDLLVKSRSAQTEFLVKLDSGYPNLGEVQIEAPPVGEWTRVAVRISDLLDNPLSQGSGLDLSNVSNVFVFEAIGEAEAHVQINNIQLSCSVNPKPAPWQVDTACGVGLEVLSVIAPTNTYARTELREAM
ncbi:MAG: glycoside hydrolase family 16 protein [Myxococcales bacterium]|nr:glycoside hydrolase family 16 protein [Myxococcales bacterium]